MSTAAIMGKMGLYEILGVASNASDSEIKRAYRLKIHEAHPDKKGGEPREFNLVKEAYDLLSNKSKARDQSCSVAGTLAS